MVYILVEFNATYHIIYDIDIYIFGSEEFVVICMLMVKKRLGTMQVNLMIFDSYFDDCN